MVIDERVARQVVIFSCLALAALTVRPIWVGIRMTRAPQVIRAEQFDGAIAGDGEPTPQEIRQAEMVLIRGMPPEQVANGFTPGQIAAAVNSNRMMDRARLEAWRERHAKRLAAAEARRPMGFVVIGVCVAVVALWGVGGMLIVRRARHDA
jgi:hypothetical protein